MTPRSLKQEFDAVADPVHSNEALVDVLNETVTNTFDLNLNNVTSGEDVVKEEGIDDASTNFGKALLLVVRFPHGSARHADPTRMLNASHADCMLEQWFLVSF